MMKLLVRIGVLGAAAGAGAGHICEHMSLETCLENEKIYYMPPCDCSSFDESATPKMKKMEYKCT